MRTPHPYRDKKHTHSYANVIHFFKSEKNLLIVIFSVGLLVRLLYIFIHPYELYSDAASYDRIGIEISSGKGYGSAIPASPGYPLFLGVVYFVFGHNVLLVQMMPAIISSFCCLLVYFIARKIRSAWTGLIASFLMTLNPALIRYSQFIMTETLFVFLVLLAIWCLLRDAKSPSFWIQVAAGIALGYASLVRVYFALFPVAILLWLLITTSRKTLLIKKASTIIYGWVIIQRRLAVMTLLMLRKCRQVILMRLKLIGYLEVERYHLS